MELAFRSPALRTMCEEQEEAVRIIGEKAASALQTRLADLRAVTYLADLPAGRPTVLEVDPPQLQFDLSAGWSLLTTVGGHEVPRTLDGRLDHGRVRRLVIEEVRQ